MRVLTVGTFDLYHRGHVRLLRACRLLAGEDGRVIVGLNTDEFIENFKGKPPIYSYNERFELLESGKYVDLVTENIGCEDSKPLLNRVSPDILVIGSDWAKKDYYKQMNFTQEWLEFEDIQLVYVPYTEGISTTELKRRINE